MINLEIVDKENISILEHLMQLYLHDINLYYNYPINSKTGIYEYEKLPSYIGDDNRRAYIIRNEEELAGFILISFREDKNVVEECFILNKFKGKGIGTTVANQIFDANRGNWEVKALPGSPLAENFWKKVIEKYTDGNYNLEHTGTYNRAEFTFNNK